MAAPRGLEPRSTGSEPVILPLNDEAMVHSARLELAACRLEGDGPVPGRVRMQWSGRSGSSTRRGSNPQPPDSSLALYQLSYSPVVIRRTCLGARGWSRTSDSRLRRPASAIRQRARMVDLRGIEPPISGCRPDVFPVSTTGPFVRTARRPSELDERCISTSALGTARSGIRCCSVTRCRAALPRHHASVGGSAHI